MKKLKFEIEIQAPIENVYSTMLDKKHFTEWISPFHAAAYFEGSWEKDANIKFLVKENDGTINGMFSRILENIPNKFVSIEHLNFIKNGVVIEDSKEENDFCGALEEYLFEEVNNGTLLKIQADTTPEYEEFYLETWPKALQKLKTLVEK